MSTRILILFRPTCGPRLGLCNARRLPTGLRTDRLSGIEIDTHGLDAGLETYNSTGCDFLLIIVRVGKELRVFAELGVGRSV